MLKNIIIALLLLFVIDNTSLQNRNSDYISEIINIIKKCAYNKGNFTIYTYLSIINIESNFKPNARGDKNEVGLMQITPAVARKYGVKYSDLFLVDLNICLGIRYLEDLYVYYNKDKLRAIYAYNAGFSKNINKKEIIESKYIKRFLLNYFNYSEKFYDKRIKK